MKNSQRYSIQNFVTFNHISIPKCNQYFDVEIVAKQAAEILQNNITQIKVNTLKMSHQLRYFQPYKLNHNKSVHLCPNNLLKIITSEIL